LHAADATALSKQIDALIEALKSDQIKDEAAQASLKKLVAKLGEFDCVVDAKKEADCKIDQLKSFAAATKTNFDQAKISFLTEKQQSDLWTSMNPLLTILVEKRDLDIKKALEFAGNQFGRAGGISEPDADVAAIADLISKAKPAIVAAKPSDNLSLVKLDEMAAKLETASQQLDDILAVLPARKRINVVSAWFGHIPTIKQKTPADPYAYNDRFCSATRALRTRCQGKFACYQTAATQAGAGAVAGNQAATTTTAELTGSSLCGFEPAPFADPMERGVVVYYECLAIGLGKWRAIGAGDPVRVSTTPLLKAELRASAIEEIRCQGTPE
jgi:hypothetical protein